MHRCTFFLVCCCPSFYVTCRRIQPSGLIWLSPTVRTVSMAEKRMRASVEAKAFLLNWNEDVSHGKFSRQPDTISSFFKLEAKFQNQVRLQQKAHNSCKKTPEGAHGRKPSSRPPHPEKSEMHFIFLEACKWFKSYLNVHCIWQNTCAWQERSS